MRIDQALHGYDEGHRQLATSAKLTRDEERTLDLLSDLSGYLPPDARFDAYETGYPCGRFYVYARTWPDWTGQRSGTVLTHSLLLSRDACNGIESLTELIPLFRFPRQPIDRETVRSYQSPIESEATHSADSLLFARARRMLAAVWFGQDIRPILWTDAETGTNAQRLLWSWLPPAHRSQHTFCTFAIQPRYLGPKLFDFLVLAKGGDSAFYSLRDRMVRCDGQHAPPSILRLLDTDWVAEIAENSAAKNQAIWREMAEFGIVPIQPSDVKLCLLYREFRRRSKEHFGAALTRIDLLQKLAPNSEQATDEKNAALWQYLEMARTQPLEQYLRIAMDILERDPRQFAPALAAEVGSIIRTAMEKGADGSPELALRALQMAQTRGFVEPAREGIRGAMHSVNATDDAQAWALRYHPLAEVLLRSDMAALRFLVNDVPSNHRNALVYQLLHSSDRMFVEPLVRSLVELSEELQDISWLEEVAAFVEPFALLGALHRHLEMVPGFDGNHVARILAKIDTKTIMQWLATACSNTFIVESLAREIAKSLPASDEATIAIQNTLPSAGGIAVLVEFATLRPMRVIAGILHESPTTIPTIFALAKQFSDRKGFDALIPVAVHLCEPQVLAEHFDVAQSEPWQRTKWAVNISDRLLITLIRRYMDGSMSAETFDAWLSSAHATHWLQRQHRMELMHEFQRARGENIGSAMDLLRSKHFAFLRDDAGFMAECFEIWARQSLTVIISILPQWLSLLKAIENRKAFIGACTVSFRIAINGHTRALAPLAEASFVPVHDGLHAHSSYDWWILDFIRDLLGNDWDRAKQIRKGLARAWLHDDWPPLSLLRAAQGQAHLFEQVAELVVDEHGGSGKRALRRLVREARNATDADPRWNAMLDRLPAKIRSDENDGW